MPKFPAHKVKIQKLEHVLDVPKYQGNENKYFKINSDGTSPELSSVAEDVQDIIGTMLVDNTQAGIVTLYNDELNKIDFNVQTDNTTMQINNENKLEVKDLGINTIKVADNAITKEKINQDIAGTGLIQEASGSISINSSFLHSEISNNNDVENNTNARHSHSNKTIIDLLSDTSGDLYYNGSPIGTTYNQTLNTTDDVTFNSVNCTSSYKINNDNALYIGNDNIHVGRDAGTSSTGTLNLFFGENAGKNNTGTSNVFIGAFAGENNTGDANVFIGKETGVTNTSGYDGTFIGRGSGLYNTTGYRNTSIGKDSLKSNTTGNKNTAIGRGSMYSNTIGSSNVCIGYASGYNETGSHKLYIANSSLEKDIWLYGDKDTSYNTRVGVGTKTLTEKFTVEGNINITGGNVLKFDGTQVVSSQQAAIIDLSGSAALTDVINKVNSILAMLRAHGLIAP